MEFGVVKTIVAKVVSEAHPKKYTPFSLLLYSNLYLTPYDVVCTPSIRCCSNLSGHSL